MNIVSPFGHLSRKGYLAAAVPLFVAILAVETTRYFAPGMILPDTPWSRWLVIAAILIDVLTWGLFCACVKRLHDFRWTGAFALSLLWPPAWGVMDIILPVIMTQGHPAWDLPQLLNALSHLGVGVRFYTWALLIVLAIVPGVKPMAADPGAAGVF